MALDTKIAALQEQLSQLMQEKQSVLEQQLKIDEEINKAREKYQPQL